MPRRHTFSGACHCGNLVVRLESEKTPAELGVRTDTCSFCKKHGGVYTSDPAGEVHLSVGEWDRLERYRFGTKTADFLICKRCGIFVAVYMPDPPLAVVNVNVLDLDARAAFLVHPVAVASFDGEQLDRRLARRRARWTPVPSFALQSK